MAFRPNVPLFNDSTDPTDPTGFATDFAEYAVGAGIALGAIVAGQRLVSYLGSATGVDDDGVEVI